MHASARAVRLRLLRAAGKLRPPAKPPAAPRSILVIRPDHLGDLILAAGAPAALRSAYPEARLTAWLGPWGEPVWRHHPALDAIETCSFPGFTRAGKPSPLQPYVLALEESRKLRGRFDLAVNLRCDFWWGAMVACWAGIATAGYDLAECRPFLGKAVSYQPGLHETDQSFRLVQAVTGQTPEDEPVPLFPDADLPAGLPRGAIAIHPGAGAEVKIWNEERWGNVASDLAAYAPIAFTAGSPEEVALAERISGRMPRAAQVVHGLTLPRLAAFYRRCRLVLGPDNGPLHVARAVGTPTVTLFGPTDSRLFGPRRDHARNEVVRLPWRCIPCGRLDYNPPELAYHLCVKLIEPQQVLAAARRVLESSNL